MSSYRVPNEHFNRIECFLVGHWGDALSLVPCDRWSCQACWGLPHHERFARPTIKQYHLQSLSNPNELDLGAVAFQSCSLTKPNMRVVHDNVDPGPHREHPRDSNERIQDIAVFHCQFLQSWPMERLNNSYTSKSLFLIAVLIPLRLLNQIV